MPEAATPSAPRIQREKEILRATIEELALSDYSGLAIEQVATRAGVNKTTVYRHWPTKADLVRSALASIAESHGLPPSSGSLRTDLLQICRYMVNFAVSFEGKCVMKMRLLDDPEPELAEIARSLQARHEIELKQFIDNAIGRGELAQGVDGRLLLDALGGAMYVKLMLKNERVDDTVIVRLVDMLLDGVRAPLTLKMKKAAIARRLFSRK